MKYDNIIIGAGPAGLQLGYFLSKLNINYVIFERNNIAGSFFDKFPHSGKLISINKRYVGSDLPDFKLRHDWNSLLSDENLLFTEYSKDFYPDKKDMVRYLNDFATKTNLNILYGMNVLSIDKIDDIDNITYKLKVKNKDNEEEIYECNKLICATGLSKPNIVINHNVKVPIKHYYEYEKNYFLEEENLKKYINKRVLIIGGGNASYELANLLTNYASHIRIYQKIHKDLSLRTNYTGDIRAVYLPFLDTFYLKSLNSVYGGGEIKIRQKDYNSKYEVLVYEDKSHIINNFDDVILATGWKFDSSIFNFTINTVKNNKYPKINYNYESDNNKNLFFIGTLMHSLDYKVSSGGFIHGFRYLIKYFVNLNYEKMFDITELNYSNLENIASFIIYKINNTSPIYQMHSVLCDILCFDKITKEIKYVNDVSIDFFKFNKIFSDNKEKIFIIITLEFSNNKINDIRELGLKLSSLGFENNSKYIHPIFKIYDFNDNVERLIEEQHLDEDLNAEFIDKEIYFDRILRILRMFIY
jgi:lysine/ornithine N-monooxygenase